jgi:hypothetical protein
VGIQSTANPVTVGQVPVITAHVATQDGGTATGQMTIDDGASAIGGGPVDANGTMTFPLASLTAGTHSITAVYAGDSNYAGSTSAVLAEVVTGPNPPPPPFGGWGTVITDLLALVQAVGDGNITAALADAAAFVMALLAVLGATVRMIALRAGFDFQAFLADLAAVLTDTGKVLGDIAAGSWTSAITDTETLVTDTETLLALFGVTDPRLALARAQLRAKRGTIRAGQGNLDADLAALTAAVSALDGAIAQESTDEAALTAAQAALTAAQAAAENDQAAVSTANASALAAAQQVVADLQG